MTMPPVPEKQLSHGSHGGGVSSTSSAGPPPADAQPRQQQEKSSGIRLHVLTDQLGRTHLVREDRAGFDGRPTFEIQPPEAVDEAARLEAEERRRPGKEGGAVVYQFRPRYPFPAKEEDAIGMLASSEEDALRMALAAFPSLRSIDSARISFSTNSRPMSASYFPARIMDDGWKALAVELPRKIRIEVADGPGDEDARQSMEDARQSMEDARQSMEDARFKRQLANFGTAVAVIGGVGVALIAAFQVI